MSFLEKRRGEKEWALKYGKIALTIPGAFGGC